MPTCRRPTRGAYNRWICEFCAGDPRLIPTAHLSLSDPEAGARTRRAVGEGAKRTSRRSPTTPARSGTRRTIRCSRPRGSRRAVRDPSDVRAAVDEGRTHGRVGEREAVAADGVGRHPTVYRQQFTTLFDYGIFDKFPRLKVVVPSRGRMDRLLARPHGRDIRPRSSAGGYPWNRSRATTSATAAGSRAIPTNARSPH